MGQAWTSRRVTHLPGARPQASHVLPSVRSYAASLLHLGCQIRILHGRMHGALDAPVSLEALCVPGLHACPPCTPSVSQTFEVPETKAHHSTARLSQERSISSMPARLQAAERAALEYNDESWSVTDAPDTFPLVLKPASKAGLARTAVYKRLCCAGAAGASRAHQQIDGLRPPARLRHGAGQLGRQRARAITLPLHDHMFQHCPWKRRLGEVHELQNI